MWNYIIDTMELAWHVFWGGIFWMIAFALVFGSGAVLSLVLAPFMYLYANIKKCFLRKRQ